MGAASCGSFPAPPASANGGESLADLSAFRQRVDGSPLDPDSDQIIDWINAHGGDQLHPDFGSPREYGIPISRVAPSQKARRVRFRAYGDESDHGRYRIPLEARVEGGAHSDGDRHVISLQRRGCKLYELYRAFPKRRHWLADSGVIWDLTSTELRADGWTSADAAGLPVYPGLVRYGEVARGGVDHAIRITFNETRDGWIHPASHCAGSTSSSNAPPMGMRLRLRGGYDLSRFSGQALPIARALKEYGAIVADNGSNWFFSGETDRRWKDGQLNQLKTLSGDDFEVVRSAAPYHAC